MRLLERITIKNFKSIREQALDLGKLNIFIGGNGSGKSNFIEVFQFLREVVDQNLANYTAQHGGADSLLHYGRKTSSSIEIELHFGEGEVANGYSIVLMPTEDDNLIVGSETLYFHDRKRYPKPFTRSLVGSKKEATVKDATQHMAKYVREVLGSYRIYHFQDTSSTAKVRGLCDVDDNRILRPDASNLAAFLYYLKRKKLENYNLIQGTVSQIAPFFERFVLEPSQLNPEKIRLEWKERNSDAYLNASSLSDGTLRFICLCTLLLQPRLPAVVLLDEPELGLHPAAITLLSELLSSASARSQVVAATQSVTLVNQFEPQDVWAVDRPKGESIFRHLAKQDMSAWLEDYALGELWEKNILGARP